MKLVFRKACECSSGAKALLPEPHMVSHAPTSRTKEVRLDIGFTCAICGRPWAGGMLVSDIDGGRFPRLKSLLKRLG